MNLFETRSIAFNILASDVGNAAPKVEELKLKREQTKQKRVEELGIEWSSKSKSRFDVSSVGR